MDCVVSTSTSHRGKKIASKTSKESTNGVGWSFPHSDSYYSWSAFHETSSNKTTTERHWKESIAKMGAGITSFRNLPMNLSADECKLLFGADFDATIFSERKFIFLTPFSYAVHRYTRAWEINYPKRFKPLNETDAVNGTVHKSRLQELYYCFIPSHICLAVSGEAQVSSNSTTVSLCNLDCSTIVNIEFSCDY